MATLDILDLLKEGYENFMTQEDDEHKRLAERTVTISPRFWLDYGSRLQDIELSWTEVKYTDLERYLGEDPTRAGRTGVYVFLVRPELQLIHLPAFIYYVGIAGEGDSNRPLRDRLRQYIQVSGVKKRNRLLLALKYYHLNTYIHFAEVELPPGELEELERNLHGFYYPWAATRDFPAPIKETQKSWGNV